MSGILAADPVLVSDTPATAPARRPWRWLGARAYLGASGDHSQGLWFTGYIRRRWPGSRAGLPLGRPARRTRVRARAAAPIKAAHTRRGNRALIRASSAICAWCWAWV
jgi:hypothetical protein